LQTTFDLHIEAARADIWRALTDSEWTRRWYHAALVTADWRPGGAVSFRIADGPEMETGTVVAIEEGRRMVLETSFIWDDRMRAEPAHRTTWEIEPSGNGVLVRLTFDVPHTAALARHLIGEEGGFLLKGLQLAVDPVEQAKVARRDTIGEVDIRDLTPEKLADYQGFFDDVGFQDHPEWQGCYCSETNLTPDLMRTVAGNRDGMSALISGGEVTALLAFADGGPVAWCNYGETTSLAGVMAKLGLEAADHERVGSVACFVISPRYRRHGLARRLLDAACARLKERGCTHVEAYPPKDSRTDYPNYRGPLAMYLRAGFAPYRDAGRSLIVRKSLGP
jgi:uncharacterized protein YndB with AHSA1/START domain/ribosomal protein S18 acetylase RimI-like enzyme